ncbi:MAG TPA: hypothetical protein VFQ39_20210, partial [Longimicrobium sp.]|nr:hypothetical protein [Longimicrobium sp.]
MSRRHAVYVAGCAGMALLVWAVGSLMTGPEGRAGVAAGAAAGCLFQLLLFGVAEVALPGNRLAAFGVGLLGRLVLVIAAALAFVPASGL